MLRSQLFGPALGACPPPGAAPPGPPAPPPPRPKYTRYTDSDLQDLYARFIAVLKAPAIPAYGSVFGDEVADQVARQMVDAIRGLPQSKAIMQTASCAAFNFIRTNWYWILAFLALVGGAGALGAYAVARKR